mmetsp:Transcript_23190/g.65790  ORF Transcript_23190/g.65790 Transcript_23190/m.65790 type:complete len:87 (+) Transcript_23190:1009-1269(+)
MAGRSVKADNVGSRLMQPLTPCIGARPVQQVLRPGSLAVLAFQSTGAGRAFLAYILIRGTPVQGALHAMRDSLLRLMPSTPWCCQS